VRLLAPVVHALDHLGRLEDHAVVLVHGLELQVGDDDGDLQDRVFLLVQARHLEVHPEQSLLHIKVKLAPATGNVQRGEVLRKISSREFGSISSEAWPAGRFGARPEAPPRPTVCTHLRA
jgi:hypothetical protein